MSQLALQLIAEAKQTNAKVLDLGLTELPNELFKLTHSDLTSYLQFTMFD